MSIKTYALDDQTINAAPGEEIVIEFRNGSVRGRFYAVDVTAWRAAVDAATSAEDLESYLGRNPPPSDEDAAFARDRFGRPWAAVRRVMRAWRGPRFDTSRIGSGSGAATPREALERIVGAAGCELVLVDRYTRKIVRRAAA